MNKTFKLYGFIFIVMMVLLAIVQVSKKKSVDWRKNFDLNKKTPFGLFIFNEELPALLNVPVLKTGMSPYEYFQTHSPKNQNILIIDENIDKESQKKLLEAVAQGSDLMIISRWHYQLLADSLKITRPDILNYDAENTLYLTDKKHEKINLRLNKMPDRQGFEYVQPTTEILGYTASTNGKGASFIKINYGKGHVFLHTEPLFLTNYYLLKKGNEKYAEAVFSYLPKRETLLFGSVYTGAQSASLLRFILSKPALKYAWWLLLAGLVLFVIFNAKRKQRVIPVTEPLKNKSVEFVKSIGNLYLQEGDFHEMMAKKAQYFLHKIRTELLIDTSELNEEFIKRLALKTNKPESMIRKALILIKKGTDPYATVIKEDLIRMNQLLDQILR